MENYLTKKSINNISIYNPRIVHEPDVDIFTKLFEKDLSPNSLKALKSDMRHFLCWYFFSNFNEPFEFDRLAERDISSYKRTCQEQCKHTARTINRRLINIRSLCKIAVEQGRLKTNVAENVKLIPLQPLAPKSLEPQELHKFMKEVELHGNTRDRLIVEMMVGAGLRVSELVNLTLQDVTITDRKGTALIRNSKGGKTRMAPLNKHIRALYQQYLEERKPTKKVFVGQRGDLKNIAFNKIIEFYAKRSQIKCTPHSFRHTFCYNYLSQNNDLIGLSQIVGHSSLETTKIYTQNRLEDLQERVEAMVY